ncbi:Bacterioferritin-associated ferredoxin [Marinomonas gallaica]|uniref:Bacterioferritin-associated ferredoxin n=1 Tax=Marinomonas gallaica TaxID=1806667 RepID=A0A1C3JSM3_9GAMM|nr:MULTISPECIES: (2Fe-2S)-binding protein [Marinomonas]MCO4784797.1 (2Fe-2S)-binding protein [Marinomonas atlantica]SBT18049.1 Bacterioferritin-associated ferredoxin [Marinomonas gallaica]SBT19843.1 Bacterioferritin-associated ferredoxin [Marinomonas gallaica]
MYVCLCNAVSDKAIKNSIANGATTMRDLYSEYNLGKQCGKCCKDVKGILNEELLKLADELLVKVA